MASDSTQSIQSFLENLKLPENYSDLLAKHGFMTVGDCHGISEDTLKKIGITLPGHYRRILSKLPGFTPKKPPRGSRVISSDETLLQDEALQPNSFPDEEGIYDSPPDIAMLVISDNHDGKSSNLGVPESTANSTTPIKPPRSPVNKRKSVSSASGINDNDFPMPPPQVLGSDEHLDRLSYSPKAMRSEQDYVNLPAASSDSIESYSLANSKDKISTTLPSPPIWLTEEQKHDPMSEVPVSSSPKEALARGDYDRLTFKTISSASADTNSTDGMSASGEVDSVYNHMSADSFSSAEAVALIKPHAFPTRNLQTAPARASANYEEISFQNSGAQVAFEPEDTYEEPVFKRLSGNLLAGNSASEISLTDSIDGHSPLGFPNDSPSQSSSQTDQIGRRDSAVRRSKSFDTYDVVSETDASIKSSTESFHTDGDISKSTEKLATKNARNSCTLPRSSGTMPASILKHKIDKQGRLPFKLWGRNRKAVKQPHDSAMFSDLSLEPDLYLNAGEIPTNDAYGSDELYQTIDQSVSHTNEKTRVSSKALSGMTKKKIAHSKKIRPVSAFVDRSQLKMHSSSEESVENCEKETTNTHKRAVSVSDAKFVTSLTSQLIEIGNNRKDSAGEQTFSLEEPLINKASKKGWLWKHGGHDGKASLRKRWIVFDGEEMIYYESEAKMDVSKGIIPVSVILRVQYDSADNRVFNIDTKGGRRYIFKAESSNEKMLWMSALEAAKILQEKKCQGNFRPGGAMYMPYKEGLLKIDGIRQKHYFATKGDQLAYYKSINEFTFGQPITRFSMKIATVKEIDRKRFQIIFPFKTFSVTAESEEETRAWVEALNDAIAEGLSDYKVVQEVCSSPANKKCADCGRDDPDWASINLAIIICKHCAGVHRDLGVHNSKVRSLKMDVKIWNETMKNMLLCLGNTVANSFWNAKLKPSEAITDMADKKQRAWHITCKYIELRYLEPHRFSGDQELLNLELIEAVRRNDLSEAYKLVFSGADPNCGTGKEHGKTPHLLAKHLGYDVMAEFLSQNGATEDVSPQGHVTDRSNCVRKKDSLPKSKAKPPILLKDHLFKYGGDFKQIDDKKKRILDFTGRPGEFQKRWCVLENNVFKYYDPERITAAKDEIDCSDLLSIGICLPEQATKAGYKHCFEVGRVTGRTYLFCAERKDTISKWINGLMQAIVPPHVQNSMKHEMDFERIGKLQMKSQSWTKKSSEWRQTWCRLKGKYFSYFHQDSMTLEAIDLRKLVQIGLDMTQEGTNAQANKEPSVTFMLVFRDKSYYFRSDTKADTESWLAAIKKADCDSGFDLTEQQLTAEGVPIILEKCTTFVEQFGLTRRGIYRLCGTHSKTTQLLNDFRHNARETQMRDSEVNVDDAANALKRWFKGLPGSLLTKELHQKWIDTSQVKSELQVKLNLYKDLIEKLPLINKVSLKILLSHLNNVASQAKENDMSVHNLAIVFGPTLLESESDEGSLFVGQTSEEIGCVEDLLQYYHWLFDVTEVDREKERLILEAKEKITIAAQQQNMLTTLDYDMMVPIYLNKKDDRCVNYKVNMNAGELVARICKTFGFPAKTMGLFEVIADGGAERPLHYSDHVLSVIKSWEMPSTNYLLAKLDYVREKLRWIDHPTTILSDTIFEGELRLFDTKKKWMKLFASLKQTDAGLTLSFTKVKNASNILLSHYNIYIGFDKSKTGKLPSSCNCGFILANRGENSKYFAVDSETNLYKWCGNVLTNKYPEGFSPPNSPALLSDPDPVRRGVDEGNSRRLTKSTISPGDIGEAARKVALQRLSSSGSTDSARENIYESASAFGTQQKSPVINHTSPSSGRPASLHPPQGDARPQRYMVSPVETQKPGGIFNMKLQSELSSVLKRRVEQ